MPPLRETTHALPVRPRGRACWRYLSSANTSSGTGSGRSRLKHWVVAIEPQLRLREVAAVAVRAASCAPLRVMTCFKTESARDARLCYRSPGILRQLIEDDRDTDWTPVRPRFVAGARAPPLFTYSQKVRGDTKQAELYQASAPACSNHGTSSAIDAEPNVEECQPICLTTTS